MRRERIPQIGTVLSVVLVGAAGCGRTQALSVPDGAVVETRDGAIAADVRTPPDGGALDDSDAVVALDVNGARETNDTNTSSDAFDTSDSTSDIGTDAPPSLPLNRYRAIAIAVGRTHNCALLDDHRVKCWGDNASGQLGLGDKKNRGADPATMGDNLPTVDLGTGRTAKSLAAGRYATCAILDDDTLKCWGVGFLVGPDANPTGLTGDEPGEMGDHLPPIELGAGRKPVAVAIGYVETCVARDDGSFLCWSGPSTEVAAATDGARVVQLAHDSGAVGLFDDGSVRKISIVSPSGPTSVDLGGRPATFVAGTFGPTYVRDCVILRAGGTACPGVPPGDVGPIPDTSDLVAIAITEYGHACGLDASAVVTCWNIQPHPEWVDTVRGNATHVPLGQPTMALGAGDYNGCALLADGTVKCWAIDGTFLSALGGSVATSTGWPAVDLGTRPAP
jgi:Regulator of chromosome condensation (RCC1) repeat